MYLVSRIRQYGIVGEFPGVDRNSGGFGSLSSIVRVGCHDYSEVATSALSRKRTFKIT